MADTYQELRPTVWDQIAAAHHAVQRRRRETVTALRSAGIPYALAGDHAVAFWVGSIDAAAVRFAKNLRLLIERRDLPRVRTVLNAAGFAFRPEPEPGEFFDGPRDRGEPDIGFVVADEPLPDGSGQTAPTLRETSGSNGETLLNLFALASLLLSRHRRVDCMHLLDMINVGLVDRTWLNRVAPEHRDRLQTLLDDPDG